MLCHFVVAEESFLINDLSLILSLFCSLPQIASHSKSSTKSRFWNRSFHILSCEESTNNIKKRRHSSSTRTTANCRNHKDVNDHISDQQQQQRLDRKHKSSTLIALEGWESALVVVIIVVLNLLTSSECLQARQEGELRLKLKAFFNVI